METETPQSPSSTIAATPVLKKNMNGGKRMKKIIGLIIGLIVVLPIGTLLLSVYAFNVRSTLIDSISQAIPLPVAQVNGHWLSYSDWRAGIATVNHFYGQKDELGLAGSLPELTQEQIESNELDRLIERELLNELAAQFDVTVTQEEIDQEYQTTIVPQALDEAEIASTIQTMYGWTIDQFKQEVVREVVLRRELQAAMNADETLNNAAKEKIGQAKTEVDGGADFFETAKTYSDDGSAPEGGDLGWIEKGQTVPEFESVAYATPVGAVSDIFSSVYGLHILKILEVDGEKVHVAHILAKFASIDEQLASLKDSSTIRKWVKVVDLAGSELDPEGE